MNRPKHNNISPEEEDGRPNENYFQEARIAVVCIEERVLSFILKIDEVDECEPKDVHAKIED